MPGDVGLQIDLGIERADYVVAVLDGLRPNVLYELGIAHAHGKPTIIMNHRDALESVPFDLAMDQRLEYEAVDANLPKRLQASIRAIDERSGP